MRRLLLLVPVVALLLWPNAPAQAYTSRQATFVGSTNAFVSWPRQCNAETQLGGACFTIPAGAAGTMQIVVQSRDNPLFSSRGAYYTIEVTGTPGIVASGTMCGWLNLPRPAGALTVSVYVDDAVQTAVDCRPRGLTNGLFTHGTVEVSTSTP